MADRKELYTKPPSPPPDFGVSEKGTILLITNSPLRFENLTTVLEYIHPTQRTLILILFMATFGSSHVQVENRLNFFTRVLQHTLKKVL